MNDPPLLDSISNYFRAERSRLVEQLIALSRLDAPSHDAPRIDAFANAYSRLLERSGLRCERISDRGGSHVFADRPSDGPEIGPPLVLVGHSDTVWPAGEAARRPPRVDGDRLYAPGVYDMRAGLLLIASAVECLRRLDAPLRRRVQVFISADEELGSVTAHPHMERLLSPDSIALVTEPPVPGGALKGTRKGVGLYTVHARGREAHAGVDPHLGASAVHALAEWTRHLTALADPDLGVTVNVGTMSGGTATNVVAGTARAGVDVRFNRAADGRRLEREIRAIASPDPSVTITVEGGIIFDPLEATPRNRALCAHATSFAKSVGIDLAIGSSGGGSDGSFLSARGFGVLDGLGADGGGAHALDEHILIDSLEERGRFLAALVLSLSRTPDL